MAIRSSFPVLLLLLYLLSHFLRHHMLYIFFLLYSVDRLCSMCMLLLHNYDLLPESPYRWCNHSYCSLDRLSFYAAASNASILSLPLCCAGWRNSYSAIIPNMYSNIALFCADITLMPMIVFIRNPV